MTDAEFIYNQTVNGTKPMMFITSSGTEMFTGIQIFSPETVASEIGSVQIYTTSGTIAF